MTLDKLKKRQLPIWSVVSHRMPKSQQIKLRLQTLTIEMHLNNLAAQDFLMLLPLLLLGRVMSNMLCEKRLDNLLIVDNNNRLPMLLMEHLFRPQLVVDKQL
jgi:hypothetical protein